MGSVVMRNGARHRTLEEYQAPKVPIVPGTHAIQKPASIEFILPLK
ncbi:hypothetical protein JI667_09205 [Bacillus sp. NTK074B]|nr:hypothetical protein [Bacillus sp. NTK074B]